MFIYDWPMWSVTLQMLEQQSNKITAQITMQGEAKSQIIRLKGKSIESQMKNQYLDKQISMV